jgi:hypothetical protein
MSYLCIVKQLKQMVMDIFEYAAKNEICFEQFMESVGKTRKTTFFSDLSIAEVYGVNNIKDTYKRVMKSWGKNLEYMCEWVISLNQKIWQHAKTYPEIAKVYDELWRKADNHCMETFKDNELVEYIRYVD